MKYKDFGIYTDELLISILVDVKPGRIFGIDYYLDDYFETYDVLSNENINKWLYDYYDDVAEEQVFKVDLNEYPHVINDYGYLGQINGQYLQRQMKELAEQIWEGLSWSN